MTISEILDHWGATKSISKLLRGVPDSEVMALAAQAAIMLGYRANERERKDVEQACVSFVTFLNRERADKTHKNYRLKP